MGERRKIKNHKNFPPPLWKPSLFSGGFIKKNEKTPPPPHSTLKGCINLHQILTQSNQVVWNCTNSTKGGAIEVPPQTSNLWKGQELKLHKFQSQKAKLYKIYSKKKILKKVLVFGDMGQALLEATFQKRELA